MISLLGVDTRQVSLSHYKETDLSLCVFRCLMKLDVVEPTSFILIAHTLQVAVRLFAVCVLAVLITKCDNIWHSSRWAWRCHGYSSFDISGCKRAWGCVALSLPSAFSYIGINEIKIRNNNFMKWRLFTSPKPRVQIKSQVFWWQVSSQVSNLCLCDLSETRVEWGDSSPHPWVVSLWENKERRVNPCTVEFDRCQLVPKIDEAWMVVLSYQVGIYPKRGDTGCGEEAGKLQR